MLNENKVNHLNFYDLFNGTLYEQKEIVKILLKNEEKHVEWTETLGT